MQNEIPNSTEFLGFLHESLLPEDSYAWTPQGKKITLPTRATILDFAFAVHTDLGLHCLGARVGSEVLGLDADIPIGETIQILQSDSQEPQENWLSIAKTQKAQTAIRQWLKKTITTQSEFLGEKIWQRELQSLKISKENYPKESDICQAFKVQNINSFYESLGKSEIPLKNVFNFLKRYSEDSYVWQKLKLFNVFSPVESAPISIGYNERFLLNYASCCNPLPGDNVRGIMKSGKGIEIHKENCKTLNKFPQGQQISLQWEQQNTVKPEYKCVFRVEASDKMQIGDILNAVSKHNAIVKKTIFENKDGQIRGRIDLLAFSSAQAKNIEQSLKAIAGIQRIKLL